MDKHTQSLCIWAGPVAIVCFFIGMFPLAHLLPPPISPTTPIAEVVAFYTNNRIGILFGEIVILWGSALMIPFMVAVYANIRRIERGFPFLATTFLFCAVIIIIEVVIPAWNFATVAFRESRPDQVTLALSDQAWLMFVWPNPQTVLMYGVVGYAILRDPAPRPLFPRWVGFANIAMGLLFLGSTLCNVFYSGPLAWNGLMAFWVPAIDFGNWFLLMFFVLRTAATRDDYQAIAA